MSIQITQSQSEYEKTIDNKLELLKFTSEVQGEIKRIMTSDFVLAKLTDKDKQMIIEIIHTAFYSIRLLSTTRKKYKIWKWIKEEEKWILIDPPKKEIEYLKKLEENTMNIFMARPQAVSILARNDANNFILRLLGGAVEPMEEPEEEIKNESVLQKIENKLRRNKIEEERKR